MISVLHALIAAVLPDPERRDYARRFRVDPLTASLILGILELFVGALLLLADAGEFVSAATEAAANMMAEGFDSAGPRDRDTDIGIAWSGAFTWLFWLVRPWTWFLASIPATGGLRLISHSLNREVVGEPTVWAGLRLTQFIRRLLGRADHRLRFGSGRPDRWTREGEELVLLTPRIQEAWNENTTIEVRGEMYRLNKREQRRDGPWTVYAYRLREEDPAAVIRALARYEPPE